MWWIFKMQIEDLIELAKRVQAQQAEAQTVEVKAAHRGCPSKLRDTLSSFSNQNSGGILLFGLDESEHFTAVGVYDLQDLQKKVTEPYLVDALSFTEAEARIIEEIRPFITGEFTVTDIKRARLSELFFNENGDRFYKIKVYFITLDEKSGAEKKTAAQMLAQATTLKEAIAVLEDGMKGTLADYTIASVTETQLMDVFPFDANSIPGEKKSGEELIAEQKQQAEQRG
mgnify:CR=1 FL=1